MYIEFKLLKQFSIMTRMLVHIKGFITQEQEERKKMFTIRDIFGRGWKSLT